MKGWVEQKFWVSTSWADRALGSRASWIVATSVSWQPVGVGVGGNDDDNGGLQPIVTKTAPGVFGIGGISSSRAPHSLIVA
jgi:hypothetical protein